MRKPATEADVFYAIIGAWFVAPSILYIIYTLAK